MLPTVGLSHMDLRARTLCWVVLIASVSCRRVEPLPKSDPATAVAFKLALFGHALAVFPFFS